MLPRFEVVGRRRPVEVVSPTSVQVDERFPAPGTRPLPQPAPYAAICLELGADPGRGRLCLDLVAHGVRLTGRYDVARGLTELEVDDGRVTTHRSRRHGRVRGASGAVALTLTGTHLTLLTHAEHAWTARARIDLGGRVDTRDESWLSALEAGYRWGGTAASPVRRMLAGGFGQVGLRDLRQVTEADGTPYRPDGRVLLSATSAGPGFFDTAHTSVWALDPATLTMTHLSDLFFRRPDRPGVYGDHATHLLRDADRWLVATSTWGDFRQGPSASVATTLAETSADLLSGRHVLDARPLRLPTTGLRSVGVWDPHLVRTETGWLAGFVSATEFFRFHPALAAGPDLDSLELRGAAGDRVATEGTTLARLDGDWLVLASDGPDGRRGQRCRYPVFDLEMREIGALEAPYPSNIPWPTLVPDGDSWLLVGFDGLGCGGPVAGYGTHGDVVFARPADPANV